MKRFLPAIFTLLTALAMGCFAPAPPDGAVRCGPPGQRRCPAGYVCAADDTCRKGALAPAQTDGPQVSPRDARPAPDLRDAEAQPTDTASVPRDAESDARDAPGPADGADLRTADLRTADLAPDTAPADVVMNTGEPCDNPGVTVCAGSAQRLRRLCDPASRRLIDAPACAAMELCDRTTGGCKVPLPACVGKAPGAAVCVGTKRTVCGSDLVTGTEKACATEELCTMGRGGDCAVCKPGDFNCDGAKLRRCKATADGFEDVMACPSEAMCNAGTGTCSSCTDGQYRCEGTLLNRCKTDRSGFELVSTCATAALCSETAKACAAPVCQVGQFNCAGTRLESCAPDRTAWILKSTCLRAEQCNKTTGVCDPLCGNAALETGEECDDGNTAVEPCTYGQASCQVCGAQCKKVAGTPRVCGDGKVDTGAETCDDGNAATERCAYGLRSCTVCDATCHQVAGRVEYCGDLAVNGAEVCDGSTGTQTCATRGFSAGTLACSPTCTFDASGCFDQPPQITSLAYGGGGNVPMWNWPLGPWVVKAIFVDPSGNFVGQLSAGTSYNFDIYPLFTLTVARGAPSTGFRLRFYRAKSEFSGTSGIEYAEYSCNDAGAIAAHCKAGTASSPWLHNPDFHL